MFDTMRHIRPDVSTCCIGLAASMGAFILASGQAGKRYSLPNSRIMIHQPLGGAQGQATDIEIQANEILHHKLTLNGYLVRGRVFCFGRGGGIGRWGEGGEGGGGRRGTWLEQGPELRDVGLTGVVTSAISDAFGPPHLAFAQSATQTSLY